MSSEISALASRLQHEDQNLFLGQLFWYSFAGVRLPHAEMVVLLQNAGINGTPPNVPTDRDVFKRVCTSVKRTKVPTDDPEVFENYLLHEFRDDETVTRRIVRESVDNVGRRMAFKECADIIFDRATGDLAVDQLAQKDCEVCDDIVAEVNIEYQMWRGCLNTYGVREWVRKYILALGATQVHPGGGTYFLRMDLSPSIEALETFAKSAKERGFGNLDFHSLPLIDDRKQRLMVQRAFESETADAIDESMDKITNLLRAGKGISTDQFARFMHDYQVTGEKTESYKELLDEKLHETSSRLDLYQRQLKELHRLVTIT